MNGRPTVFRARRFLTLDSAMPQAEAVAVSDGRVLHSGTFADVMSDLAGQDPQVDDSFIDSVVVPGFVEAHCHIFGEAALASQPWVGSYDRRAVTGVVQTGCADVRAALARVAEAHAALADPNEILVCMGWDPSMAGGEAMTGEMLDSVSESRPIFVFHTSLHIGVGNMAMMQRAGITRDTDVHGVMRHGDGEPNGELRENALSLVMGNYIRIGGDESIRSAGTVARQAGCTTVTDLGFGATTKSVKLHANVVDDDAFESRVYYAPNVRVLNDRMKEETVGHIVALSRGGSDKFRMGPAKFVIDGSIQGRTARMNWPGYCCGDPNGMWLFDNDELFELMLPYHRAGLQIALHTNGDEAVDKGLDVFERLLTEHPRFDHRHRLEHAQLATEHAFRRMKALGMCVNLFANHVYYWGETHRNETAGPARARRLDACGTALRLGVPFSIHCDAPVTPLDPLFTIWCAVNRITSAGLPLGETERISAADALRAMTIDAAYLLKADGSIGSIESGKFADFTVLSDDPTTCDPMGIKDLTVRATVLSGRVNEN